MTASPKPGNDVPLEISIPDGGVCLESILCTEELHRRPFRPPDYKKENNALVALASGLADSRNTILQTLAETILQVTESDSSGVSLLTKDDGGKRFYWPAIAGMWKPHIGGGTPRDFGPCGDVLDRNCSLLFKHFEWRYPYLRPVTPPAEECLLVPFYVGCKAVGTIWAIMHSDRRKFDAEDERLMSVLGQFASLAYQTLASIEDLKSQMAARQTAEAGLRKLTDGLEAQVRVRTEELEKRNQQLAEARARLADEKLDLERSEAYLSEGEKLSHTGSWHWDVASGKVDASKECFSIFGLDSETNKGSYSLFIERVHPDDRSNIEAVVRAAVNEKRDWEAEFRLLLPGGLIKYLYDIARCRVSQSGDVEYLGVAMDITERKRAEQELRASEERHRVIVEAASDAVVSVDENGVILLANASTSIIFGFDPVELIGKPLTILMPEFLRKVHEAGFRRYLVTGNRHMNWQGTELTGLRKNGQEFPVEISFGELIKDGHRVFTGFVRDISERKRAEEALRRSETYLAEAQRLTHTGSWAGNILTREIFHSSDEHSRLYGLDPERGKPSYEDLYQRVHPEDQVRLVESFERASRAGTDVDVNYRIVLPDGTSKHVQAVGHPVSKPSGETGEFAGFLMDVTERRRAEEERERLRQAQADLAHINRVSTMGELTASVAHEIKQPISAAVTDAKTCLRWLERDQPNVAEAREAASRLIKDVTSASDIISRIGSLFKKDVPQRELLDIRKLIHEMIALVHSEANQYSISIHCDLADGLPQISADRVGLQQVLMNLMLNGIEAMKDMGTGGKLTIKSQQDENRQILISVADTGAGLQPEQAGQIFDAFFTSKPQGIGMGLTISRSIIESHGGRLWPTFNSGPGATFQFTLPIEAIAH